MVQYYVTYHLVFWINILCFCKVIMMNLVFTIYVYEQSIYTDAVSQLDFIPHYIWFLSSGFFYRKFLEWGDGALVQGRKDLRTQSTNKWMIPWSFYLVLLFLVWWKISDEVRIRGENISWIWVPIWYDIYIKKML